MVSADCRVRSLCQIVERSPQAGWSIDATSHWSYSEGVQGLLILYIEYSKTCEVCMRNVVTVLILLLIGLSGCGRPADADGLITGDDTSASSVVVTTPPVMKTYRGGR